ncbi:hypothetical protein [Halocola ammonii]
MKASIISISLCFVCLSLTKFNQWDWNGAGLSTYLNNELVKTASQSNDSDVSEFFKFNNCSQKLENRDVALKVEVTTGCTYANACNFDPEAELEDGSCDFTSCAGCTYPTACNYDPDATLDDGSCDYESCAGCTYVFANNYDPTALIDDDSCEFPILEDPCPLDADEDGFIATGDLLVLLSSMGSGCPE